MMLMPKKNFDWFEDCFDNDIFFENRKNILMKTDVRETKDNYIIDVDLPGYDKDEINLSLENGYLKVEANCEKEENDETGKYIKRERFVGKASRSFYVGDDIKEENIDAEFKNGTLKITIPKKELIENNNEIKKIEIK